MLNKYTQTFQVKDLLEKTLTHQQAKQNLIGKIVDFENAHHLTDRLLNLPAAELANALIEGLDKTDFQYFSEYHHDKRFDLLPMYNFFFTRDASMSVYDKVLIGQMISDVRQREAFIMQAIFENTDLFQTQTMVPQNWTKFNKKVSIEGGDVLVIRHDVLAIGFAQRTSPHAIDFLIDYFKAQNKKQYIVLQELPSEPESFIHLDMAFTMLDQNTCMTYKPLIVGPSHFRSVLVTIDHGKVTFMEIDSIQKGLAKLGIDLEPLSCGGTKDMWHKNREQWHSGTNFFALEPGKVIGYARNVHTIEELHKNGFEVIEAQEYIDGKRQIDDYNKCVITIDGAELSRGGGGARCMTMPVNRQAVDW